MTALDYEKELIDTARLYQIFEENEDAERAAKAELFAKKVLKNNFIIGFAGHFSSGKSSMINALTGETLLPSSPIPTSANIVNVQKADADFAIVNMKDEKPVYFPENYDFEAVKAFCKSGNVIQIEIGHKDSVLPQGITVMDTPGVDSTDDAHRMSTESALHVADMVFYVMDYNHVQSELNFNFTKELQKYTDLYLIVNQIDKHQDQELSFADFKQSVQDSFAAWGVKPKGIFFTSLKDYEFPGNDFAKVKDLVASSMEGWKGHVGTAAHQALQQLKDEHLRFLEEEKIERLHAFSSVLSPEEWAMREDVKIEMAKVSRRMSVLDFDDWQKNFEKSRKELVENANIMPYELRNALTAYLESVQPNFKVGLLFSGKKTQEERDARKIEVGDRLATVVASQISNHMKKLMKASLKDAGLLTDEEALAIDGKAYDVPFSVVEEQIPRGAVLSGDAVLNFANSITSAVQKWFIKETDGWKKAQKEKFEALSDDASTEMDMKANQLNQKLLAIQTLEEMDSRIGKVKRDFSAVLPTQKQAAEEKVRQWQKSFHVSVEDMKKFDPSMLQAESAEGPENERSTEEAAVASFNEQEVMHRALRTSDAIAPIKGFAETAEYLKRKAARLNGQEFTIALFGAFSAGKSSFSNALLGEKVLPVSPNPTTATINRIRPVTRNHPHETADVRLKTAAQLTEDVRNSFQALGVPVASLDEAYKKASQIPAIQAAEQQVHKSFIAAFEKGYPVFQNKLGETIRANREEFGEYVAKEEKSCFVDEIDFYYDCDLTRSGVTLVDTPGADSINARHTNVAFEYIRNADAILFITYYNHAFARADREFLIQLGRVKDAFEMDKMFFIVNAIDLANSEEEKEAVENYVRSELQRFGIRFPRLFGVSSLMALADKQSSGMPQFEEEFHHFLKEELKGMAVQSLAEEEHKALGRFRSLIEHTEKNLLRKDERLGELKRLEQQLRILFSASIAKLLEKEALQELDELVYYVNQRVFYRFNDFFKEAFNPSVFTGKAPQQALDAALAEITGMAAFDFQQELRVTNFRLAQFIEKRLAGRFKEDTQKLIDMNPDFSFTPYEPEEPAMLSVDKPFHNADYSAVKSHYKNNKSFFEKNEKEKLRDALQALMEPDALRFLEQEKVKLAEWAEFWIEQEAEGLRQHILRQAIDQIDSERTLLQEQEKLTEWKERLSNLLGERV
ncbi:dynamin family protein [Planomicrobium sp. CPCC 101110]|uniref:dynamin family protein n=1 Tax=Planomicrobium sp. CPCC 101110 TaxID=2599619 RepID=UPI0011B628B7|nr:dynamin family protein [Planomicrobium sp. CPCC 101110]TWT28354.1 GTPase [Planomicrobium sp. CPCC 101110]